MILMVTAVYGSKMLPSATGMSEDLWDGFKYGGGYYWYLPEVEFVDLNSLKYYGTTNAKGKVAKFFFSHDNDPNNWKSYRLVLINKQGIFLPDYTSWSVDVMFSSETTAGEYNFSIDYHTAWTQGVSWYSSFSLTRWDWGGDFFNYHVNEKNVGDQRIDNIRGFKYDTWYNLRMQVDTRESDRSLPKNKIRIKFFIDEELVHSEIIPDYKWLLDPDSIRVDPFRNIGIASKTKGDVVVYIDNVRAVYGLVKSEAKAE